MLLVVLVILAIAFLFGGFGYRGGAYQGHGIGLAGLIVLVLIILWLTGNL